MIIEIFLCATAFSLKFGLWKKFVFIRCQFHPFLATKPNDPNPNMRSLVQKKSTYMPKPVWHAPWKLMRVISGHLGWVRSVTVEPGNEWFATGEFRAHAVPHLLFLSRH